MKLLLKQTIIKKYDANEIEKCVKNSYWGQHIPFKVEEFKLDYLGECIGYIKRYDDGKFKLKCVDNDYFPMILRLVQSGYVMLNDLFFMHKGTLASFYDVPENIRKVFNYNSVVLEDEYENQAEKTGKAFKMLAERLRKM